MFQALVLLEDECSELGWTDLFLHRAFLLVEVIVSKQTPQQGHFRKCPGSCAGDWVVRDGLFEAVSFKLRSECCGDFGREHSKRSKQLVQRP